jgi:parvulin-like peptidyl-prolyl isomerase
MAIGIRIAASGILALALAGPALGGEAAPQPAKGEARKPIVATVNGEIITEFDVQAVLGPHLKDMLRGTPEEQEEQIRVLRERALRELVLTEIIVQEAKRTGVRITDAMVRQKLQEEARQSGGWVSYYRLFAERGLSWADNWERVKRDLYIDELRHRILLSRSRTKFLLRVPEIQVSPQEVRAFYRRHPEEFQEPTAGRFRMIRLDFEKFDSRKAARDLAEELLARVRAEADPAGRARLFADLARRHSVDQNATAGGAWDLRAEAELLPELHAVVLKLKPGELSDIIVQEYGLFLFFLEQPMGKKCRPFEEVREDIESRLQLQRLEERWDEESRLLLESARLWPPGMARILEKGEQGP